MIIGIGTDIIDINRIERACVRTKSFLTKVFSDDEIRYFTKKNNSYESLAGIFAAKEATSKALGTGFRGFNLKDIEVLHNNYGRPQISLSQKVVHKFSLANYKIHLSISHSNNDAIAFVVIEGVDR